MSYYCPECGFKQTQRITEHRGITSFSWEYDFVCENCDLIINVENFGPNHSERDEE